MERVLEDEDLLHQILKKVAYNEDRKHCSEVSKLWLTVEGITHTSLATSYPEYLPTILPRFPNLTKLKIYAMSSDQTLHFISRMCPSLHTLEANLSAGDDGLLAIANGCRHLTEVSLLDINKISDVGVIALIKSARNLASLCLKLFCNITDNSCEAMSTVMTSLTKLEIYGCRGITDHGIVCLTNGLTAKTLTTLDLSGCDLVTDNGLAHLGKMVCLQNLFLARMDLGSGAMTAISTISGLRRLDLSFNVNISDVTLANVFQKCHKLVEIDLKYCDQVRCSGLSHKSLQVLWIEGTALSVPDAALLVANFPSLRYVSLDPSLSMQISTFAKQDLSSRCTVEWL